MSLRGLRYFLVAAETVNFRRAAEKLFITQQTLSAHIQKLESRYGTPLFERKPHLRLTPAGHCLREYARKAVKLEELFLAELADVTDTVTGRLNVGITGFRATIFMPRIWEIFHAQFPNITPSMTEAPTAQLDELLDKGQLDLYIGVDAPVRKNTEAWTLSQEKACCIASREFVRRFFDEDLLRKAERGFEISDLIHLPQVGFSRGNTLRESLDIYYQERGLHPRVVFETSRHDLALRFCEQGCGIGFVYQMSLYDLLQKDRARTDLRVFAVRNDFPPKHTMLVYRCESYKPRYMTGFVEAARKVFKEYSDSIDGIIAGAMAQGEK